MMMIRRMALSVFLSATVVASGTAFGQAKPGHLDEVLRQMDAASAKFRSAQADFKWDLYERVVKQTTTQNGSIYFVKDGAKTQMGAKILPPSERFLEYKDGTLTIFDPGSNHETIVSAKQNQNQMESFLTLGFGGSGHELANAWTISDLGMEPMSDGMKTVQTAKLDLVSKDQGVRNMCTHIYIWVDPQRGISLKQVFFMPSEDTKTSYYTNIRYNEKVDTAPYKIKLGKNPSIDRR
jgi:outer membrane lipoprotein-sorting protein